MTSVFMDQISWVDYQQRVNEGAVVFLPCGATEQHGPHLPLGTDALLSTAIAATADQRPAHLGCCAVFVGAKKLPVIATP